MLDKETTMKYNVAIDLKYIRKLLHLSQQDIAERIGVKRLTIIRIENNQFFPSNDTLEKIYDFAYKNKIRFNNLKEMFYRDDLKHGEKLLFHSSKQEIVGEISPKMGNEYTDFGKAFYCGESLNQTASFVSRFTNSSLYMLSFNPDGLKKISFSVDQEWMLAIAYYRGQINKYKDHPLIQNIINRISSFNYIIAPIADNRMFNIIDRFINGEITDEQCKYCLSATYLGFQYVFLSMKSTSRLKILEKCYLSKTEKEEHDYIRKANIKDGDNKVKMPLIKYKNVGKYIGELLK